MRAGTHGTALAIVLTLGLPVTAAFGQAGYLTRDPNVSVDMSVLEGVGPPSTVAGQPARQTADELIILPPLAFPPPTMPVSRLTGPLANLPLQPAPRRQAPARPSPAATPAAAPPPPVAVQPPPPAPEPTRPPEPAPASVAVRAAAPPPPPAAKPAETPATTTPAVAPAAQAQSPAAPPPPQPETPPAPPEPATSDRSAASGASTPALTPAPTGAAADTSVQTAARTETASSEAARSESASSEAAGDGVSYRVLFDNDSATISDSARTALQDLLDKMKESENLRVQLLAYASGTDETASQARRLSLSRALAVRSFLINEGVRSTRMDVRALGNQAEGGPADRVDAVLVER